MLIHRCPHRPGLHSDREVSHYSPTFYRCWLIWTKNNVYCLQPTHFQTSRLQRLDCNLRAFKWKPLWITICQSPGQTFSKGCQIGWSCQEQDSSSLGKGNVMVCVMIMLKPVKTCRCALLLNESRKQHFKFSNLSPSFPAIIIEHLLLGAAEMSRLLISG